MHIEEHYWRERSRRVVTKATRSLNYHLKAFWRLLTFQIYRDSYKLVKQAVAVYGHGIGRFKTVDPTDKQVNAIAQRISDSEHAVCWGVDCAHVARYMDKSYEEYIAESSQSYKILWRLTYAMQTSDYKLIDEAMDEAYSHIESYEKAYSDRKAPERPGDAPRTSIDCVGEEGTLP